ncbi:MAG TPA: serine/threonine-protein kinase [Kofleriaceae bacterium]|jgi:serine/threonine-protein kinase
MGDELIGTEVGRYRVERLLGQGGMGAVYLGIQPAIGSRVAIKVLSAECARNPQLLDRFFAEARSVNLIHHESIVSVLDLAQLTDGRPYIVMEFVEGQTLGELVRDSSPLPLGGVVQVMTETLSALAAAHNRGVVHRDLKPDNIIVTREGHAKVLDFGIAKLAPGLDANSPRTATGALLGTPAYMAPEQISGAQLVDSRTDIYAAGVVLFEIVTGRAPFTGETLFDLMRAHLEQTPPNPRSLRPDLTVALEHVILRAMEKDPARRFQTAMEMADAIRAASVELPGEQWKTLAGNALTGRPSLQNISLSGARSRPGFEQTEIATGEKTMPSKGEKTVAGTNPNPPTQAAPTLTRDSRTGLFVALGIVVLAAGAIAIMVIVSGGRKASVQAPIVTVVQPVPIDAAVVVEAPPVDAQVIAETPAKPPAKAPTPAKAPEAPPAKTTPPPVTSTPAITTTTNSKGEQVVHINGELDIATPVPEDKLTRVAATYNAKAFDGKANAAKALELARATWSDAGLVEIDMEYVSGQGFVDLTHDDAEASYMFRSPSRTGECYLEVIANTKGWIVRVRDNSSDAKCKAPIRAIPKCSIAAVRTKAGVAPNRFVKVEFLKDGKWFVSNMIDDDENLSETVPDGC